MSNMVRSLSVVVLVLVCLRQALGDGVLFLKLEEFDNPGGMGSNGHCCDGKWGLCQSNGCDHMFALCVDEVGGTSGMQECLYGERMSDKLKDSNHNVFGPDINGLANPMQFTVRGDLPSRVLLKVTIKDKDTGNFWAGSNDHVDFLSSIATVSKGTADTGAVIQTSTMRTTLAFRLWQECGDDWYGTHCGVHCPPPNANDHYFCDPNSGGKLCREGWAGNACSVEITTSTQPTTTLTTTTTTTTTTPVPTTTTTTTTPVPTSPEPTPVQWIERDNADCDTLAQNGFSYEDGLYNIRPGSGPAFRVYCDMSSKGWTVIQRRWDGSVNFDKSWVEYQEGFGDPAFGKNYWMGLDNLYRLTNQRSYKLRITMKLGTGEFRYANYDSFRIGSEKYKYALHVDGYSGTAGDAFKYSGQENNRWHDGMPFSTRDRDNDSWRNGSCGMRYRSGWWFKNCYWANLNGRFKSRTNGCPTCEDGICIAWKSIDGYKDYSLVRVEMKVMPNPRSPMH